MSGSRRGLIAPQNTFLDNIIRRCNGTYGNFLLANARIVEYPIVYCNEGFCKLSGYNRAEVLQKSSLCPFMHNDETSRDCIKLMENAMNTNEQLQVELSLNKRNKTPLWLIVQVAPIKNEKDLVVLFLLTFRDVTALKQPTLDEEEQDKIAVGLSKFARLAKSVTRNRSIIQQVNIDLNNVDDARGERFPNILALNSGDLPQYKQETPKTPPHIILHYAIFKTLWDWLILLLTGYTAIIVPFSVTFEANSRSNVAFLITDSIVDIIFFIDIILSFHTTFVGPNGEVISDPIIIRVNYLKGWFVVDFLACLPYGVLSVFESESDQGVKGLFSALRLIHLLRLGRVARKLEQYVEYVAALLLLMIFGFLLLAHWLACIWYLVGLNDLSNSIYAGWIPRLVNDSLDFQAWNGTTELPSQVSTYSTALYFTMSLVTSIGFGNVSAYTDLEKVVSICFMLIGSLLYATIFGNVTTIVQQMYATRAKYQEMINSVKEFLKIHDMPPELGERVLDYVTSSWAVTKGIDTAKVLNYCPKDMKADLCVHLNRMVFNEHPAFRLASDGCLRSLAVNFITLHTAPGDLIFHQGESIDQLCFVVSGSLEVIQDEEIVGILGRGDVFGDNVWKDPTQTPSSATVRALTYCDLHCIKRSKLMEVLQFYHGFAISFTRNLVLTFNLRNRLIFRKIADLKKEKELSEKRKNDPPLADLSADHPVRKLLSRFRKVNDVKGTPPPTSNDVSPLTENGSNSLTSPTANGGLSHQTLTSGTDNGDATTPGNEGPLIPAPPVPRPPAPGRGRWSKFLNNKVAETSSSGGSPMTESGSSNLSISPVQNTQVMQKLGRVIHKQATITEEESSTSEDSSRVNHNNADNASSCKDSMYQTVKVDHIATKSDPVQIATILADFRHEIRQEIASVHEKLLLMTQRMDSILSAIGTMQPSSHSHSTLPADSGNVLVNKKGAAASGLPIQFQIRPSSADSSSASPLVSRRSSGEDSNQSRDSNTNHKSLMTTTLAHPSPSTETLTTVLGDSTSRSNSNSDILNDLDSSV